MSASQLAISALKKENEENYHAHGKSKLTAFLECVTSVLRFTGPPKTEVTNHPKKKSLELGNKAHCSVELLHCNRAIFSLP